MKLNIELVFYICESEGSKIEPTNEEEIQKCIDNLHKNKSGDCHNWTAGHLQYGGFALV